MAHDVVRYRGLGKRMQPNKAAQQGSPTRQPNKAAQQGSPTMKPGLCPFLEQFPADQHPAYLIGAGTDFV